MAKSKSMTQTVTDGCVGRKGKDSSCWEAFQHRRSCKVRKIEAQGSSGQGSRGIRLMIIELERYNKIRELLIENRTTGLQGHVCYQDGGWRVSVTMVAVCMGVEEIGMQIGHRVHTIGLWVGSESRYAHNHH